LSKLTHSVGRRVVLFSCVIWVCLTYTVRGGLYYDVDCAGWLILMAGNARPACLLKTKMPGNNDLAGTVFGTDDL